MKRLTDAEYLSRQPVVPVQESQVPGLTPSIKEMCQLCLLYGYPGMAAPEVGIPYSFFLAWDQNTKQPSFDTLFNPEWEPVYEQRDGVMVAAQTYVDQQDLSGYLCKVLRYKKIHLRWSLYNGSHYEFYEGDFEGSVAYLAQHMCDRLNGKYLTGDGNV